jgi:tRNA(His) guanylyltransferase
MKDQYEDRTRILLPRRTYTILRLDGKAFHTYTRGCMKPFDHDLMHAMDRTAEYLCENIQNARFAYTQSDEITILLTDFEKITTSAWFDANLQKIVSVASSMATARFNQVRMAQGHTKLAHFDCRAFTVPDRIEVSNNLIWRMNDASRNSVSMLARSLYSAKELQGKTIRDQHEMIHAKGMNWNDLSVRERRGGFVDRVVTVTDPESGVSRTAWKTIEPPVFSQDQEFLSSRIPKYSEMT